MVGIERHVIAEGASIIISLTFLGEDYPTGKIAWIYTKFTYYQPWTIITRGDIIIITTLEEY